MSIEQFKYRLPEADALYAAALAAGGYTRFSQENRMGAAVIQTVLFDINDTRVTLQVSGKRGKIIPFPRAGVPVKPEEDKELYINKMHGILF
jgi:hypothetical protein